MRNDKLSAFKQRLRQGANNFDFDALIEGVSTLDNPEETAQPAAPESPAPEDAAPAATAQAPVAEEQVTATPVLAEAAPTAEALESAPGVETPVQEPAAPEPVLVTAEATQPEPIVAEAISVQVEAAGASPETAIAAPEPLPALMGLMPEPAPEPLAPPVLGAGAAPPPESGAGGPADSPSPVLGRGGRGVRAPGQAGAAPPVLGAGGAPPHDTRLRAALLSLSGRLTSGLQQMRDALSRGETEDAGIHLAHVNQALELLQDLDPTGDLSRRLEIPNAPPPGRTWPVSAWSVTEFAESPLSGLLPRGADDSVVRALLYAAWGVTLQAA